MTIQFSKQKTNVGLVCFFQESERAGLVPVRNPRIIRFWKTFFSWPFLVWQKLFEKGTPHAKPVFGAFFGAISLCLLLEFLGN